MDSRRKRIRFCKKVLRKGKSKLMHSKIGIVNSYSIEKGTPEFNIYESYAPPLLITKPPKFLEELKDVFDPTIFDPISKLVSEFRDQLKFLKDIPDDEILKRLEKIWDEIDTYPLKLLHTDMKFFKDDDKCEETDDIRHMYPSIRVYDSSDVEKIKSFIDETQGRLADLFDIPREFLNTYNTHEIKAIHEIYKLIHESSEKVPEGLQFKESLIWCISDLLCIPELQSSVIVKQNYLDMEYRNIEDAIFYTLRNDTGKMLRSILHDLYRSDESVIGFLYFRLDKSNKRIEYKLYDYQNYISNNTERDKPKLPAIYSFKRWYDGISEFEPIRCTVKITNGSEENLNEKTEENS